MGLGREGGEHITSESREMGRRTVMKSQGMHASPIPGPPTCTPAPGIPVQGHPQKLTCVCLTLHSSPLKAEEYLCTHFITMAWPRPREERSLQHQQQLERPRGESCKPAAASGAIRACGEVCKGGAGSGLWSKGTQWVCCNHPHWTFVVLGTCCSVFHMYLPSRPGSNRTTFPSFPLHIVWGPKFTAG